MPSAVALRRRRGALALLALLAGGCVGAIEGGGRPTATSGAAPMQSAPPVPPPRAVGASATLRLLTRDEYANALRDLVGDDGHIADPLPADPVFLGVAPGATMTDLRAETYGNIAEAVATRVTAANLGAFTGCAGANQTSACAHAFIGRFARRAFRRPPTDDELRRLQALYDGSVTADGFAGAIALCVQAVLQSPSFLFVMEFGGASQPPDRLRLTDHELATRLSLFLWGSIPDATLDMAADQGQLSRPGELERQARRMLADHRTADALRAMHADWLNTRALADTQRNRKFYPQFKPGLAAAMAQEIDLFVADAAANDGTLETFLTGPFSYVNADVANVYGLTAPATPWTRTALDPARRGGLLTLPGILTATAHTNQTSPVLRGKLVREGLLCTPPRPPPPDVQVNVPAPDPSVSTRERFEQHESEVGCSGCHKLLDPIGFGFEQYDAIGQYRASDGGKPIDASGTLAATQDADGDFVGVGQLAARLAQSAQVADCVARRWFRFALKRGEEQDASSLAAARDVFRRSGGSFRELAVALVTSDAFRTRRQVP